MGKGEGRDGDFKGQHSKGLKTRKNGSLMERFFDHDVEQCDLESRVGYPVCW